MTSSTTISSSGGLTSTSTLTNAGANGVLQITGLASGINSTQLIQAEMAEMEQPATNMQSEITGLQAEDTSLSTIQDSMDVVNLDAQVLGEPSLFFPSQSISSTNPNLVSAATSDGVGAVVGSSTISVSQLASSAQRTFNYTAPTSAETLTIDGKDLNVAAGETVQSLAGAINGSDSLDVWASYETTSSGQQQLVLSSRTTGNNDSSAGTYINVQDGSTQVSGTGTYGEPGYVAGSAGTVLTEVGSLAQDGTDAQYMVNGVSGSSPTDTVTNALPGVTLTLSGITSSTDPVSITTAAPTTNTANIVSQVQQFVTDYNSAISAVESDVNTAPASESQSSDYNPNSGSLFGDVDLENFLSEMRNSIYQSDSTLPSGLQSLSDLGVTTGASTGAISGSSVNGQLTVNSSTLEAALASNPTGVQALLTSWSNSFQKLMTHEAQPGGDISGRINGNTQLVTSLQTQYTSMMQMYTQEETAMEQQWAQVESTLEGLDNQKTSLTSFASGLTTTTSSSSS